MGLSGRIKPVSYLEANADEMLRTLAEDRAPYIITQNGEGRAVLQDLAAYEEAQQALAMLKLMLMGEEDIAAGRVVDARPAVEALRSRPREG